jgi:hypothetical protein
LAAACNNQILKLEVADLWSELKLAKSLPTCRKTQEAVAANGTQ